MKRWVIIGSIAIIVVIAAILYFTFRNKNSNNISYRTVPVQYGDLICTIAATGTVEPEELIDVGAQVAGRIVSFGTDKNGKTIDYGSIVEEKTVLAKIDDVLFQADLLENQASVAQAKALMLKAEADLNQMKSKFNLAANDFKRAAILRNVDVNSKAEYDSFKSAYEIAKANIDVGMAVISQAKAQVAAAESKLNRAKLNLGYCTISSPVKGVVIDRRVNIGQTVVASLNAPSLFLIAKDLKRMEVWSTVNEADVGKIKQGQTVTFTVDAYPGETFTGKVVKVRLNASITQNVVTYVVVISTDNSNGKLLPYLTANVKFETDKIPNVFMVPSAALRWIPNPRLIDDEYKKVVTELYESKSDEQNQQGKDKDNATTDTDRDKDKSKAKNKDKENSLDKDSGIIWLLKDDKPVPLKVKTGLSNDSVTQVEAKDLKEGMMIIVGIQPRSADNSAAGSPFMPKFGNQRGGGARMR